VFRSNAVVKIRRCSRYPGGVGSSIGSAPYGFRILTLGLQVAQIMGDRESRRKRKSVGRGK